MAAAVASHPISSKQGNFQIKDTHIDIICTNYGNRLNIIISDTQLQKVATMLLIRRDGSKGPDALCTYTVNTLLGMNNPEVHVFGRAIGGHILVPEIPDTSIILGLGLIDPNPLIIPLILKQLNDLDVWSLN